MANPGHKPGALEAAVEAYHKAGTIAGAARLLDLPRTTVADQINTAERKGLIHIADPSLYPGRKILDLENGTILAGSDAHYWPGPASTAHRAFVSFTKEYKPDIVIMNGDAMDMAKVSRFPIGWTRMPEVREEIEVAQERLGEIETAHPKAKRLWACGNHDSRFELRIAAVAPELGGVPGTSLQDHFPNWTPCWSVFVNDHPGGIVFKHRFKGGLHAAMNNSLWSGRTTVTGHLHRQHTSPVTDYNGTRWGVDLGCLADPWGHAFAYLEDNPRNWVAGFAMFTIAKGVLMPPELITVLRAGAVAFRGKVIEV